MKILIIINKFQLIENKGINYTKKTLYLSHKLKELFYFYFSVIKYFSWNEELYYENWII